MKRRDGKGKGGEVEKNGRGGEGKGDGRDGSEALPPNVKSWIRLWSPLLFSRIYAHDFQHAKM